VADFYLPPLRLVTRNFFFLFCWWLSLPPAVPFFFADADVIDFQYPTAFPPSFIEKADVFSPFSDLFLPGSLFCWFLSPPPCQACTTAYCFFIFCDISVVVLDLYPRRAICTFFGFRSFCQFLPAVLFSFFETP